MEKFTKVTGVAAPLMRQNVDTDLIIRIERLVNNPGRKGLGPYCFEQIRFKPDGSENPDCVFNQEPYREAPIILSRENFGCGSSREGAVWALAAAGDLAHRRGGTARRRNAGFAGQCAPHGRSRELHRGLSDRPRHSLQGGCAAPARHAEWGRRHRPDDGPEEGDRGLAGRRPERASLGLVVSARSRAMGSVVLAALDALDEA